jgi:uncharacterized integral membrane protein
VAEAMGSGGQGPHAPRDRKRDTRMVLLGVIAVLLVWFAVINLQNVQIHFWLHTSRAPLIVVVVITAVLGGGIAALMLRRRNQSSNTQS